MHKNPKFSGASTILTKGGKLKFRYVLRPFVFVIYFKFKGNWFHVNGFRAKIRCPNAMKRTIHVIEFSNMVARFPI